MLSAVAVGVQVTMVLTLVGVSRGMLADMANRSRGVSSLSAITRVASARSAGRSGTGGVSPGNVMP